MTNSHLYGWQIKKDLMTHDPEASLCQHTQLKLPRSRQQYLSSLFTTIQTLFTDSKMQQIGESFDQEPVNHKD
jgi:hypothetical protein